MTKMLYFDEEEGEINSLLDDSFLGKSELQCLSSNNENAKNIKRLSCLSPVQNDLAAGTLEA